MLNQDISTFGTELKQYLDQPNIARIGQKYLISPASSVASEKIASAINKEVPNNRSRLRGDHIQQRVFQKQFQENTGLINYLIFYFIRIFIPRLKLFHQPRRSQPKLVSFLYLTLKFT